MNLDCSMAWHWSGKTCMGENWGVGFGNWRWVNLDEQGLASGATWTKALGRSLCVNHLVIVYLGHDSALFTTMPCPHHLFFLSRKPSLSFSPPPLPLPFLKYVLVCKGMWNSDHVEFSEPSVGLWGSVTFRTCGVFRSNPALTIWVSPSLLT